MAGDNSILNTTKKALGLAADYTAFDPEIVMHINSVFSTLNQLGLGPAEGFMIEDDFAEWGDYLGTSPLQNHVKSYMYLRVRMLFDPPQVGFVITAFEKQLEELTWRINVAREEIDHPPADPTIPVTDDPFFDDPLILDGGSA